MIGIFFATMQLDTAKKTNSKKQVKKTNTTVKKVAKKKIPKVTITGKPSCRTCAKRASYRWRTTTFINYCPNCKHYNCLRKNPKGVPERELTCSRCDCDYCTHCGADKSGGHRHYYNKLKRG